MTPVYTASSAAAPVLDYEARATATPAPAQPRKAITYQPGLFSSRELPRVVPFETIAPGLVETPPNRKTPAAGHRTRHRRANPGQQNFEFSSAARNSRPADGVIYCDASVAVPAHRALAAALDASVILIALGLFGLIFRLAGGQIILNSKTIPMFLGAVAALAIFYKLLWCLAQGDTAGMRWTRLTLVNFDGQLPNQKQRFYRLATGCLSLMAAGIGLLWALVDEETLTWHDHISKTFPTPF
jgi:uncharacterized RDD family membrane protein YckC